MLKVIAVTSKVRVPSMPNVPTVGESIPGYEFYSWYGVWGPAKLPQDIAQKLNAEVNKALAGDMKQEARGAGTAAHTGLDRRLREVSARRHGARAEDHHRRQHTCRVRPGSDALRPAGRRHRQQFRDRPRGGRSACWRCGGTVHGFDRAPAALARAAVSRACVEPHRQRTDECGRRARACTRMRWCTPRRLLRVGTLGTLRVAPAGGRCGSVHVDARRHAWPTRCVPKMAARGNGRVVLIGSRVASGMAGRSQYAATKAALIALARSWAAEVAPHGVTVNVVSVRGHRGLPMLERGAPNRASCCAEASRRLVGLIQPEEVAGLVTFLLVATSRGDHRTGHSNLRRIVAVTISFFLLSAIAMKIPTSAKSPSPSTPTSATPTSTSRK